MPAPVSDSTRGGGHLARDTGATAALLGRLAAAIAVTLLGVAWPAAAFAHTELVSASPADGASVDELPATIELTFSEALSTPAFVTVTDPAGAEVHVGDPTIQDQVVTQQTEGTGLAGGYEVEYRVVAGDGHAVSGSLSFTVTSGSSAARGERADSASDEPSASDGFWDDHWQAVAAGGGGLLAGIAVLGAGLMRARH